MLKYITVHMPDKSIEISKHLIHKKGMHVTGSQLGSSVVSSWILQCSIGAKECLKQPWWTNSKYQRNGIHWCLPQNRFYYSAKVEPWSGDSYSLEANRYFQDGPLFCSVDHSHSPKNGTWTSKVFFFYLLHRCCFYPRNDKAIKHASFFYCSLRFVSIYGYPGLATAAWGWSFNGFVLQLPGLLLVGKQGRQCSCQALKKSQV